MSQPATYLNLTSSFPISPTELTSHLTLSPDQFKVSLPLHTELTIDLTLTNTSSQPVAFKVKTTARDRYALRPTQDIIPAGERKVCRIVLTPITTLPPNDDSTLRDKFLIQSITYPSDDPVISKLELNALWKQLEALHQPKQQQFIYSEQRIKCKVIILNSTTTTTTTVSRPMSAVPSESSVATAPTMLHSTRSQQSLTTSNISQSTQQQQQRLQAQQQSTAQRTMIQSTSNESNHSSPSSRRLSSNRPTQLRHTVTDHSSYDSNSQIPSTRTSDNEGRRTTQLSSSSGKELQQHEIESEFERISSERHRMEYNDLMDFLVKLTATLEKEKQHSHQLQLKLEQAQQQIQQQQTQLQSFQKVVQQRSKETEHATVEGSNEADKTADNKANNSNTTSCSNQTSQTQKPTSTHSNKHNTAVSPSLPTPSATSSFSIYQILTLALLCFVLGKIFGTQSTPS